MVLQNLGFRGANVLLSPDLQAWSWNGSPSTERQDYLHSVFQIRKKALGHEGNTITSYLSADINNFSMNSPGTRKNSSLLKEIANLTHRERTTFKEINKVWYPIFSPIQISKNQSKKKINKTKTNKQRSGNKILYLNLFHASFVFEELIVSMTELTQESWNPELNMWRSGLSHDNTSSVLSSTQCKVSHTIYHLNQYLYAAI